MNMKYIIEISGNRLLLSDVQMTALDEVLIGATREDSVFAGSGKGDDGGIYRKLISPFVFDEHVTLKTMSEDRYEALVLKTKLLKGEAK
jgi:hypothetical protein